MNNLSTPQSPPWNFGLPFAGQTLDWLPTDTEHYFKQAMQDPEHRAYFEALGWHLPGAITYKINRHGFRCDEIVDGEPCVIALGCSYTAGIGLPIEVIWPTLVGQSLNMRVVNLSWGGLSADSCFRLAEYWIPKLRPKLVTMLTPPVARLELCLDEQAVKGFRNVPVDVYIPGGDDIKDSWFLKNWFSNEENHRINSVKNKLAIRQLCRDLGIPCTIQDAATCMTGSRQELGYARDLLHAGIPAHKKIAETIINDWSKTQHA
jgi:hypothetical protein